MMPVFCLSLIQKKGKFDSNSSQIRLKTYFFAKRLQVSEFKSICFEILIISYVRIQKKALNQALLSKIRLQIRLQTIFDSKERIEDSEGFEAVIISNLFDNGISSVIFCCQVKFNTSTKDFAKFSCKFSCKQKTEVYFDDMSISMISTNFRLFFASKPKFLLSRVRYLTQGEQLDFQSSITSKERR